MQSSRHPHPHIDPRQPRNDTAPSVNPPVFAWKPVGNETHFRLCVSHDPELGSPAIDVQLSEPLFLPEKALDTGTWYWRWTSGNDKTRSEVFHFEITDESVKLEIPPVDEWLKAMTDKHPRIYTRPEELDGLRQRCAAGKHPDWPVLKEKADILLQEEQTMAEPPFLPGRDVDYKKNFDIWLKILQDSRRFMIDAKMLGLAYLASGDQAYARAACERLASVSAWDPEGSSYLPHNDEAHMSLIWHGPMAIDWVWEHFTDEERAVVIEQFRRRGEITFEFMHGKGSYGVTRFDSHAGREIIFLAQIALVLHEHIPAAREWLEWLRPVLCGIWPIWARDDGGWAEGPSYGLAYVTIMTIFATTLKRGTGLDLYRKPFWQGHARWRQWCWPPYAEWIGFGDHSERWAGSWYSNANLVDIISRETESDAFTAYVQAFREEAGTCPDRANMKTMPIAPQLFLSEKTPSPAGGARSDTIYAEFTGAGLCAVRTDLERPGNDIALLFRSSPYGAVSHSHANNNDFILHIAGKAMLTPSGYYDGYGSDHHTHWVWHTKSHNCVTLSDAGQLMRSHDSAGEIINAHEDERLVYFCGRADRSYADRAEICRRHVVFLKAHTCFVMLDEFRARPGIVSCLQWNIHSRAEFETDLDSRGFKLAREGSLLEGHCLYHHNAFFSLTEGWDPPPMESKRSDQWHNQYHLRFTCTGLRTRGLLGTILCPGHAGLKPAAVTMLREGEAETALIGDDIVMVNQIEGAMRYKDITSSALACLIIDGQKYEVSNDGIKTLDV